MISTIRALRSTLNLLLSIVEVFIGLAFAIKVFGSDAIADGGIVGYIVQLLTGMGDGVTGFAGNMEIAGPLAFLVLILGFMLFSAALFLAIPSILRQGRRNAEIDVGYE